MADGTGKVDYNSDLVRKSWVMEGLIQKSATSFWAPYKGKSLDTAVIVTENDISAGKGHTVVFDFDGNLSSRAIKGNKTAKGKGEQKKKFSDKLTVSDYRYVVDNGTKFDGVNIGDLSINEHSDSRNKLADLWVRSEDQAYFDLGQQGAEFGINFDGSDTDHTFDLDGLTHMEEVVKTGTGWDVHPTGISKRLPLKPWKLSNGDPVWLVVIDVSIKKKFMQAAKNVLQQADLRGNDNRLLKSVIGKIGNFVYVEAQTFFGETVGDILVNGYYEYENTAVEIPGLRQIDANGNFSGTENYDGTAVKSRGLILGAGAFQKGNGLMPDYKYEDTDFGKFSESCLEVWCGTKCTKLEAENSDYADGKVAGYNYGVAYFDVTL